MSYYSQTDEEPVILSVLDAAKQTGRFLDVGAYDGKTFSNTLRLVELGWGGALVEAAPTIFSALIKLHGNNPNLTLVNAALAPEAGFRDFYDANGDALSTFDQGHRDLWAAKAQVPFRKMSIYGITWDMLFDALGSDFDFISLDVEGISAVLFLKLPLNRLPKTRAIIVEHDYRQQEIEEYARLFGFHYHWHNAENLLVMR